MDLDIYQRTMIGSRRIKPAGFLASTSMTEPFPVLPLNRPVGFSRQRTLSVSLQRQCPSNSVRPPLLFLQDLMLMEKKAIELGN